jgi:hypothetical protein
MANRYLELIPDPDVVLLDDHIGHWPQIEDPDAVIAHFLDFIKRVGGDAHPNPAGPGGHKPRESTGSGSHGASDGY